MKPVLQTVNGDPELCRSRGDTAVHDFLAGDKLAEYFRCLSDRDGETDALEFLVDYLHGGDTDDITGHIYKRTAAVAGVDRAVCLDKRHRFDDLAGAVRDLYIPRDAADDTAGHGAGKALGIGRADGDDVFADL